MKEKISKEEKAKVALKDSEPTVKVGYTGKPEYAIMGYYDNNDDRPNTEVLEYCRSREECKGALKRWQNKEIPEEEGELIILGIYELKRVE